MSDELIQFPTLEEIKEMLVEAREDINAELEEDPELEPLSKLLFKVIDQLDEKVAKHKDLNKISEKEKIDLAAHLCFLNSLEDDFFFNDDDMDGAEFEEVDLIEEEVTPVTKKKKK